MSGYVCTIHMRALQEGKPQSYQLIVCRGRRYVTVITNNHTAYFLVFIVIIVKRHVFSLYFCLADECTRHRPTVCLRYERWTAVLYCCGGTGMECSGLAGCRVLKEGCLL